MKMSLKNIDISNAKEKFNGFLSNKNYKNIVLALGFGGMLLIFCSNFFKPKLTEKTKSNETVTCSSYSDYTTNLENSLESVVSSIEGAGQSKVLLTLESGTETIYATEEKINKVTSEDKADNNTLRTKLSDDCEKKYITVRDSDGSEKALAVTELQPKIKGALIVCAGGDNPAVKQRIIESISTVLNLPTNRICVTKLEAKN